MKKNSKIMIIGLLVLLLSCAYAYFLFNKKPSTDTLAKETEVSISSDKLLSSFSIDETKANTDFTEKTIEVEGSIKKITFVNDRYTILLQGEKNDSHVICDVLPSSFKKANQLKPGQMVRLKGVCKGYLMDVVMLNCILLNGRFNE